MCSSENDDFLIMNAYHNNDFYERGIPGIPIWK